MSDQEMYREDANLYDLIYSGKDYKSEAADVRALIKRYQRSYGKELLDVACGTAEHLTFLKQGLRCTGVDINGGMLRIAKRKLPSIRFVSQDMTKLALHRRFDVITCLFSSIGYLRTEGELSRTFKAFAKHLKPGGVALIEPWLTPEKFKQGYPHMTTYNSKKMKIARLSVSSKRGPFSVIDFHWLVAKEGKRVRHFVDHHELRLTTSHRLIQLLQAAGLEAKYLEKGLGDRGILVGVKPLVT